MQTENEMLSETDADGKGLRDRLERLYDRGIGLFVDGRAVLPCDAAVSAVCEDNCYMADYVFGDKGQIAQIRFDRVTEL